MPPSVLDLFQDPALRLQPIVSGDLSRPVRWVHVTELLDPSRFVLDDAVILSAGVWGPRGARVDTFVDALTRTGAIALGWGLLEEEEDTVPSAVVRACRRAGLTLFAVPTETSFIEVSQAFVTRLQDEREAEMRTTIERNDRLVRALASGSGAAPRILSSLREELACELWLLRESGRVVAAAAADARLPADRELAMHPLAGGAQLAVDGPDDAERHAAIRQALPFLEFALARQHDAQRAEAGLAAELVDVALAGQTGFARSRLHAYGLDPQGPLTGVVAHVPQPEQAVGEAQRTLRRLRVDGVVAAYDGSLIAIVQPGGADDVNAIGERLSAALGGDAAVGIGPRSDGVDGLRRSIIQAREAATLARRSGAPGGWARYDQLSSHAVLLALQDEDVLSTFRSTLLAPIEEHDARRRTELLRTLESFLDSGCQWQATADRLNIHVNTLRHRLERCEALTGRDLGAMGDRVDFYIALKSRAR